MKLLRNFLLPLFLLSIFSSCKEKENIAAGRKKIGVQLFTIEKQIAAIKNFEKNFSLEEKISQLFLVNINGSKNFHPHEEYHGRPLIPGSYIFFSYNLQNNAKGVIDFTDSITNYCKENNYIPPFLCIDQEGGSVNRLKKLTSPLPSHQEVAKKLNPKEAYELYSLQAGQMKALGFHMNLSPVAEASNEYNKDFLEERSFGSIQNTVTYSKKHIDAYQDKGISCVIKHFPGNTNTDPHIGLPVFQIEKSCFEENFLFPFKSIFESKADAVLLSHAIIPLYDENPADLSSFWIEEVLKKDLNFSGLTMSDDLLMGALSKNGFPPEKAIIMALDSGIDLIMLSQTNFSSLLEIILFKAKEDTAFLEKINKSFLRIIRYKIKIGLLSFVQNDDASLSLKANYELNDDDAFEKFSMYKNQGEKFYLEHFVNEKK